MKRLAVCLGLVVISIAMIAGNMHAMDTCEAGMTKENYGSSKDSLLLRPLPLPKKIGVVDKPSQNSTAEKLIKAAMLTSENKLRVSQ